MDGPSERLTPRALTAVFQPTRGPANAGGRGRWVEQPWMCSATRLLRRDNSLKRLRRRGEREQAVPLKQHQRVKWSFLTQMEEKSAALFRPA